MIDEELRKKMEPNVPTIKKRIEVLNKIQTAGITVGVTAIPLFPHISDGEKDLEKLIKTLAENGADYVIIDTLNFREETRNRIIPFITEKYPELVARYEELYKTNYCDKEYAKQVRKYANKLVQRYKVDNYDKMFSYHKS